ncbi:hypothetical protein OSB52_22630, partial [Gordonia sp. SW 21]|nr:hypothetical protein [Gordonia aquimaris]
MAASTREVFTAGGGGAAMTRESAMVLGQSLDEARVVFGTEVTRRDTAALKAAQERGTTGHAAIAEATRHENVWHGTAPWESFWAPKRRAALPPQPTGATTPTSSLIRATVSSRARQGT